MKVRYYIALGAWLMITSFSCRASLPVDTQITPSPEINAELNASLGDSQTLGQNNDPAASLPNNTDPQVADKQTQLSPSQQQLLNTANALAEQHAKANDCTDAVDRLFKQALGISVYKAPFISPSSPLQAGDHVIYHNGNQYTGDHSVMILGPSSSGAPNSYSVFDQGSTARGAQIRELTIRPNLIKSINRCTAHA